MARKKSTATSETTETAVQTEAAQAVVIDSNKSYTATWAKQAGKSVKGLNGVLITFDAEGKASVDADNARHLQKMPGVLIAEAVEA